MEIKVHGAKGLSYEAIAQEIVEQYSKQNELPQKVIDERISRISRLLIGDIETSISLDKANPANITINIQDDILPEDMRTWAQNTKRLEICRKVERCVAVLSSIDEIDFQNIDWSSVAFVERATSGHRGAWFYNTKQGSVVVKSQEGATAQLLGTAFLRSICMQTPDSRLIKKDSIEGQEITKLGAEHGIKERESLYPSKHFIVMERIKGKAFDDLSASSESINIVRKNLEEIGRLAIYDLALGNHDRFHLFDEGFNGGNIMFDEDGELVAIDTDCLTSDDDDKKLIRKAFNKIVSGDSQYASKVIRKLARGLGVKEECFDIAQVQGGMHDGIKRLCDLYDKLDRVKEPFMQSIRDRGGELDAFPDYVIERLQQLKTIVINNPNFNAL